MLLHLHFENTVTDLKRKLGLNFVSDKDLKTVKLFYYNRIFVDLVISAATIGISFL